MGRQTVRLSLSNLYKKKGDKYAHLAGSSVNLVHDPPVRGWVVLVFDIPGKGEGRRGRGERGARVRE